MQVEFDVNWFPPIFLSTHFTRQYKVVVVEIRSESLPRLLINFSMPYEKLDETFVMNGDVFAAVVVA